MRYQDDEWITQQKRYEKLIKSYQANDLSNEYVQLKEEKEAIKEKLTLQTAENIQLTEELDRKEKELHQLHKVLDSEKLVRNEEIIMFLENFLVEELLQHLQSIDHLIEGISILEQQPSKKEVIHTMSTNNSIDNVERTITEQAPRSLSLRKNKNNNEDTDDRKPRPFQFQDLQSYDSAYILPEPAQNSSSKLTPKPLYYDKKLLLKKLKEKQREKIQAQQKSVQDELKHEVLPEPTPIKEKEVSEPVKEQEHVEKVVVAKESPPRKNAWMQKLANMLKKREPW